MAVVRIVACLAAFVMTFILAAGQKEIPTWLYPILVGVFFLIAQKAK